MGFAPAYAVPASRRVAIIGIRVVAVIVIAVVVGSATPIPIGISGQCSECEARTESAKATSKSAATEASPGEAAATKTATTEAAMHASTTVETTTTAETAATTTVGRRYGRHRRCRCET